MRYTVIQKNLFNLVLRTGWLTHESFYRDIFNSERLEEIDFEPKYPLFKDIGSAFLAYDNKTDSFWESYIILSIKEFDKEIGVALGNISTVYTSEDMLVSYEYQIRNAKLPVFNDVNFLLRFESFDCEKESLFPVNFKCSFFRPMKKRVRDLVEIDRHLGAAGLLLLFGVDKKFSQKLITGIVTKTHFNLPSKRGMNIAKALTGDLNHIQRFLINHVTGFNRTFLNDNLILSDLNTLIRMVKDLEGLSFDLKVACFHLIFLNKYRKIRNSFSRESEKVIKELLDLRINGVLDWDEFHGCIYLLGYSVSNSNLLNYRIHKDEIAISYSPLESNILPKKEEELGSLLDNNFGANWRLHFSENELNSPDFEFRIKCASGWLTVGELSQKYLRNSSSELNLQGVMSEYERVKKGGEVNLSKISQQIEKYGPTFFESVNIWNKISHVR